jgi:hypothetical protein
MTATRDRIEHLVVGIQSDFLDIPTLALTLPRCGETVRHRRGRMCWCAGRAGGCPGAHRAGRGLSQVLSITGGTASRLDPRKAGAAIRPNPQTGECGRL